MYTYKASGGSPWPLTGLRKECLSSKELHGWCQKINWSLWLNWPFCHLGGLVNTWSSFTVPTRGEEGGPNRQRKKKNCTIILSYVLGWPKSSFEFSHKMLWKSPNKRFVWSAQYIKQNCMLYNIVSYTLIRLEVEGLICHDRKRKLRLQIAGFCFPHVAWSDSTLLPKQSLKFDLWCGLQKKKIMTASPEATCLLLGRYFVWLLPDPIPRNLIRPRESHTGKECLHLFREMCPK